jgi:SAM-dependent methyltransferase
MGRTPDRAANGAHVASWATAEPAGLNRKEDAMTTDMIEERRRELYEIAQAIAPTWERRRAEIEDATAPVRAWMLKELRPREGDTVLELAAGVGETGFEAAAAVGGTGRLITSDLSPAMLEAARRRGEELALANVDYRVFDAERIELDDDCVDGVLCRFGYMLMIDPPAAFAETRRVLRSGGRVTLAVWAALERNPFFGIIVLSLIQRGHIPPPEDSPANGPFSMASGERVERLLRDAGFAEVRTEDVSGRFVVPDVDGYLSLIADTAGPIGLALRGLSETDRAEVRAEVEDLLGRFASGTGFELPCVAVCAVAS